MSPVDRVGSVSEIAPRHPFLYKNFDVFILEGWLARLPWSRFTELEISPIWTLQPGYRDVPWRNIFNCTWPVRSLTGRNAVQRVFGGPLGHFLSWWPGFNFPYKQKTKFVPPTGLIWIDPKGLIHGGKFVLQNRLGLYLEGNLRLKIDWACLLLYAFTKV